MTIGDQYRAITPHDQLIFDSTGAVVGIRSGQSSGADMRVPPTSLAAAVASLYVTGLVMENSSADARTYNSALLLSAIGSLSSTYGGELILPSGSIYINPDVVYADRPLLLRGRGRPGWKGLVGATLLKTVADGDAITLLAEGSSLRDFGVVCEKPTQPTGGAGHCMAARELPCDILNVENGCTGIGVRPFRHITAFKEPVTILACKPCAAWWRTRHPDA